MNRKIALRILIALAVAFAVAQLIPVPRTNPSVEQEPPMPAEVRTVLVKACYDCHSNETKWPWYSYVAPMSWLVAYDVKAGRKELNFSTWNTLRPGKGDKMLQEVWEVIEDGEMPLAIYTPAHPEARLTNAEKEIIRAWTALQPPNTHL
jgi:hypothetical protein